MRFLISLCLIPINCFGLIHIQSPSHGQAMLIENIFQKKYQIPKELIEVEITNGVCTSNIKNKVLSLCINEKRELVLLSQDIRTLKESFKVFLEPTRGSK